MKTRNNSAADWRTRIEPILEPLGLELVQAENPGDTLRVYIDRVDAAPVGIEDCERASRALSAAVPEVEELTLEVSSPGLDRPLDKPSDFERFRGQRARLQARTPIGGSRNFIGILEGGGDEGVRLRAESGAPITLPWDNLAQARLAPLNPLPAGSIKSGSSKQR